jgi:hypothetical protein
MVMNKSGGPPALGPLNSIGEAESLCYLSQRPNSRTLEKSSRASLESWKKEKPMMMQLEAFGAKGIFALGMAADSDQSR